MVSCAKYLYHVLVTLSCITLTFTTTHEHGELTVEDFQHVTDPSWKDEGLHDLIHNVKESINCTGLSQFCDQCLTVNALQTVFETTDLADVSPADVSLTLLAFLVNGSESICQENATNPFALLNQSISITNEHDLEHLLEDLAAVLNYTVSLEEHGGHTETEDESHHEPEHDLDHDSEHAHNHSHHEEHAGCFGSESLLHEVSLMKSSDSPEVKYSYAIINHLLAGDILNFECPVKASQRDFLNALTAKIANSTIPTTHIPFEGMEAMLTSIGVGGLVDSHTDETGEDNHQGHDHKRSIEQISPAEKCFTSEELIEAFGVEHGESIDSDLLPDISMAAVQQIYGGYCRPTVAITTEAPASTQVPAWESWGIGILSVAIISALAVLGGLLFPCMEHDFVQDILTLFIGLAVGTMSGDALLHLIPQAVGLHDHSGEHEDHGHHTGGIYVEDYTWKMLVVVGAIYLFFLFETLMSKFGHSHLTNHGDCDNGKVPHADTLEKINEIVLTDVNLNLGEKENNNRSQSKRDLISSEASISTDTDTESHGKNKNFCRLPTVAYMIVVGDVLHNFVDGLAIGAGFAAGWREGLTVAIAVLCHELPHELGDFAVLLATGLSPKQVLLANLFAACCAFLGLSIGIPISSSATTRSWIFAATAGMFLYVSLVNMVPELAKRKSKSNFRLFVLQNTGLIVGFGCMFAIAVLEESIFIE